MKEFLMSLGLSEEDAEKAVAEGLPQFQANVAYSESMRDLIRMESADDFLSEGDR